MQHLIAKAPVSSVSIKGCCNKAIGYQHDVSLVFLSGKCVRATVCITKLGRHKYTIVPWIEVTYCSTMDFGYLGSGKICSINRRAFRISSRPAEELQVIPIRYRGSQGSLSGLGFRV